MQPTRRSLSHKLGQHWQASSVASCKKTCVRFLISAGAIAATDAPAHCLLPSSTPPPLQVTDRVVANSMDFVFVQPFTGGEVITKAGTVIAVDAGQNIFTPHDDCVLVMPSVRQLRPCVTTVRLVKLVLAQ